MKVISPLDGGGQEVILTLIQGGCNFILRPTLLILEPPALQIIIGQSLTSQGTEAAGHQCRTAAVKGGQTSVLSSGRSAKRCSRCGPLSFLHRTQAPMTFVTTLWPPISQKPACLIAPPVMSPLVVYFMMIVFSY